MPAPRVRADYESLAQIARAFGAQAEAVQATLRGLQRQVDVLRGGDWVGRGATAFYSEIDQSVFPSLSRLAHALAAAGSVTLQISQSMKTAEAEAAALFRLAGSGVGAAATTSLAAGLGGAEEGLSPAPGAQLRVDGPAPEPSVQVFTPSGTNVFDPTGEPLSEAEFWEKYSALSVQYDREAKALSRETVAAIAARKADLAHHGLHPTDTEAYDAGIAVNTVFFNPENRKAIETMAERYGLRPGLLAGIIAAEMDFDHSYWKDKFADGLARRGLSLGDSPGIASVHTPILNHAIDYLRANGLAGAEPAQQFPTGDNQYRASFEGSVESAAIVAAMYAHAHGGVQSAEDMAVVWGAFRTGIRGFVPGDDGAGYASLADFRQNVANGTANYPAQFQIGGNAYMSQPYFEFFDRAIGNEQHLRLLNDSYWLMQSLRPDSGS